MSAQKDFNLLTGPVYSSLFPHPMSITLPFPASIGVDGVENQDTIVVHIAGTHSIAGWMGCPRWRSNWRP